MSSLHITLLFAGLCALLQCLLTALVIRQRITAGVNLLDGGDEPLLRRIRAHGNFVETAPMALLLLALLELRGLGAAWLWGIGICLVLGRLFHLAGILNKQAMWSRLVGMVLTLCVLSLQGVLCLWLFLR
jgi:uncharacterized protein